MQPVQQPNEPWPHDDAARAGTLHGEERATLHLDLGAPTLPPPPEAFAASSRDAIHAENTHRCRDIVTRALERMNLLYSIADETHIWIEIPPHSASSAVFATRLFEATGVALMPGSAASTRGEGYARITLTQDAAQLTDAMERWERWLIGCSLNLEIA